MAVRKLVLCAILAMCLAIVVPAWAGTLQFTGTTFAGQGALSFTPGLGNDLTIGAGNGGQGALITDLVNNLFICNGDCAITGGYLTLMSGGETSGSAGGGSFTYTFGAGGQIQIFGSIPSHNINSALIFSAQFLPGGIFTGAGTIGSYIASLNLGSIFLNPNLGTYKYVGGANNDISITINNGCGNGGPCNGSIYNSLTTIQTIPEPATLSVLGVGLFAFGAGLRRKMLGA
jgi:PEP-CTERM motif-containing protein